MTSRQATRRAWMWRDSSSASSCTIGATDAAVRSTATIVSRFSVTDALVASSEMRYGAATRVSGGMAMTNHATSVDTSRPIKGLMQDYPLTLHHVFWRLEKLFGPKEVVTRRERGVHRYTNADLARRVYRLA